jgi:predicted nucleic acid-binding protein
VALLDAYALVAFIADEPAAGEVEPFLRGRDAQIIVVNLAETIDVTQRVHGRSADEVRAALEPLLLGGALSITVSQEADAWLAASLRASHYDRKTRALSLADCLLLAHAVAGNDVIATADPALAVAARGEGVGIVALPDSTGKRPESD